MATERFTLEESDLDKANAASKLSHTQELPVFKRQDEGKSGPTTVIVVGMAGAGKSSLMNALYVQNYDAEKSQENEEQQQQLNYFLNLDPATKSVPFGASIDIRDTIDYKEVMKQHNLGPNGAIMTSLNLFATKFDQVMQILDTKTSYKHILVDTPGQIEAFTWSASGTIMSEALASSFPTVLAFVVDTPRCVSSPSTFMSNMLYACSMMYRTRLPIVIVFNKTDVVPHEICEEWMNDFEAFHDALDQHSANSDSGGYYNTLTRSMSMVLDEFYCNLHRCGVSAMTGDGMDEFWACIENATTDFEQEYIPDLKNRMEEQTAKQRAIAKEGMARLQRDLATNDASA